MVKKILPLPFYLQIRKVYFFIYYFLPRQRILMKKITFFPSKQPWLSYASMAPKEEKIVSGGRVKLIYLNRVFPEQVNKFNILYLISSTLPQHLKEWIMISKKSGVKIVLNQNGVYYKGWYGPGWEAGNEPLSWALHAADYVMYQSAFCKQSADKFLAVPRCPWSIVYNALDTSFFTPRKSNNNKNDVLRILVGGTQSQLYKLETALRVLSVLKNRIKNVQLLVAGGFSWTRHQKQAEITVGRFLKEYNVSDQVVFLGKYTQLNAPDIFRKADIYLHPKYNDPCPTAVLEAMSCGLPIVYSKSGGLPELVGDDCGEGIDVKLSYEQNIIPAAEQWAEAILKAREKQAVYSQAVRKRAVTLFDLKLWVRKHKEIFDRVLSNS